MNAIRHCVLSLPLVVLPAALAFAADSPAIPALKEKGLSRSGRLFVIEAEGPVIEKVKEARAVVAEYAAIAARKIEAQRATQELAQLEERRAEIQEKLDEMNQLITEQGFPQGNNPQRQGGNGFGQTPFLAQMMSQRTLMQRSLSEITSAQKSLKADTPTGADKKALDEESKTSLEATRSTLIELRKMVDEVTKKYEELEADSSVKLALKELENEKLGSFKLGPSTTFKTAVKTLEKAERSILARKTATVSRKKGKSRR